MNKDIKDNNKEITRSAALSALVQSANLVDRLASQGQIPITSYEIMRASLFKFDVEDIQNIYQANDDNSEFVNPLSQNLSTGIRVCKQIFQDGASREYPHTIRYVMALIQLEKHFRKSTEMQNEVRNRLVNIGNHLKHGDIDQKISDLYLDTLAKLPFRIQVLGKMQYLQNNENEHQVRVLLFSGIRAAMLWRQYGGRRWQFLLAKNSIIQGLDAIK